MTRLARLIDDRLRDLDWTRAQLAAELGIVGVSVSRWLRREGDHPIPWRHYDALARILRVPVTHILDAAGKDWPGHVAAYHRFVARRTHVSPRARRRRI